MKYDPNIHHRRSIRLKGWDYRQPGAYFVTLVTFRRDEIFGEAADGVMRLSGLGEIAREHWRAIPDHFPMVELGAYVVMPNHVHGIITIKSPVSEAVDRSVGATQWVAPTGVTPTGVNTGVDGTGNVKPNGPKRGSIGAIVGAYKMSVTRRSQNELNVTGIWQRNYYEHIIRNDSELQKIWDYIEANPLRWESDQLHPSAQPNKFNQE